MAYSTTHIRIPTYVLLYIDTQPMCEFVCVCKYEINKIFFGTAIFLQHKTIFFIGKLFSFNIFFIYDAARERERGFEMFLNM
jgi:hypothetical protein